MASRFCKVARRTWWRSSAIASIRVDVRLMDFAKAHATFDNSIDECIANAGTPTSDTARETASVLESNLVELSQSESSGFRVRRRRKAEGEVGGRVATAVVTLPIAHGPPMEFAGT